MLYHYVQEAEEALTNSQKILENCKEYNPGDHQAWTPTWLSEVMEELSGASSGPNSSQTTGSLHTHLAPCQHPEPNTWHS